MTGAEDSTDRAGEPLACPQCGKVDHVHKLSAIPDMPPEYGPPREPSSIDLAGVVPVALGTVFILVIPFTTGWMGMMGLYLIAWGAQRLLSKQDQKARWQKAMRRWERLYFCARDEVAFIPRGASAIPPHRVQDSLYMDQEQWQSLLPKRERFWDFAQMPEEFADFVQMLEEAKEESETLICFECGHNNPVGQTQCEECRAWVPQTAKARWVYGKDK